VSPNETVDNQPEPLPWHDAVLSRLRSAWTQQRLPHALLLHGAAGLGKSVFARWLARLALCDSPRSPAAPCETCASCKLTRAGTHPDFLLIEPIEDKRTISVDQIRAASEKIALTSYRGGRKVAIVAPADLMTVNAANSLLKTLEEPPDSSLLVLVTSSPGRLPATIRSRSMRLGFHAPDHATARAWAEQRVDRPIRDAVMSYAAGAPLAALEALDDEFDELDAAMRTAISDLATGRRSLSAIAGDWSGEGLEVRLKWFEFWLASVIRSRIAGIDDQVTQAGASVPLPSPALRLNISALYQLLDEARQLRSVLVRTALQKELAVESLLIPLVRTDRTDRS
jgi:DNA polymerase-3 subunit delta'